MSREFPPMTSRLSPYWQCCESSPCHEGRLRSAPCPEPKRIDFTSGRNLDQGAAWREALQQRSLRQGLLRRLGRYTTRPYHHKDSAAAVIASSAASAANKADTSVSFFCAVMRMPSDWYTPFRSSAVPA
jgi:hypothetical protein